MLCNQIKEWIGSRAQGSEWFKFYSFQEITLTHPFSDHLPMEWSRCILNQNAIRNVLNVENSDRQLIKVVIKVSGICNSWTTLIMVLFVRTILLACRNNLRVIETVGACCIICDIRSSLVASTLTCWRYKSSLPLTVAWISLYHWIMPTQQLFIYHQNSSIYFLSNMIQILSLMHIILND